MADRYGNGETREPMETHRASSSPREPAGSGLGGVGWALAGAAGVAALAVLGAQRLEPSKRGGARESDSEKGGSEDPEVLSSLTIERPADELYRVWRDPATLPRVMGFLAEIRPRGEGRGAERVARRRPPRPKPCLGHAGHRRAAGRADPREFGRGRPRDRVRDPLPPGIGRSRHGHHPARPLRSPGGMLGDVAARFFGGVVPKGLASKALHAFKSLVLTGEIPTTDRQPAARRDSR